MKDLKVGISIYMISLVLFLPFFFINYRLLAFNTLPYDDYFSFILHLDGKLESLQFTSPQGYRFLFYLSGYFLYKVTPFIELSQMNLSNGIDYYKALQSLSLVSFLCLHAYFYMCYLQASRFSGSNPLLSLATGLICLILSLQAYFYAIDAMYFLYVTLMIYHLSRPGIFIALMLLSVFVNEKISILFFFTFGACLFSVTRLKFYRLYFLAALMALILYFAERYFLKFPGYEYQTDFSQFWNRISTSLPYIFSFKGIYVNLLPLATLVCIGVLSYQTGFFKSGKDTAFTSLTILALPFLFFILGMFTCSDYGIGRVTFHTFPLFIPQVIYLLKQIDIKKNRLVTLECPIQDVKYP